MIFTFRTVVDPINGNGAREMDVIASPNPWFIISEPRESIQRKKNEKNKNVIIPNDIKWNDEKLPKSIWLLFENFLSTMLGSCSWSDWRPVAMPEIDTVSGSIDDDFGDLVEV